MRARIGRCKAGPCHAHADGVTRQQARISRTRHIDGGCGRAVIGLATDCQTTHRDGCLVHRQRAIGWRKRVVGRAHACHAGGDGIGAHVRRTARRTVVGRGCSADCGRPHQACGTGVTVRIARVSRTQRGQAVGAIRHVRAVARDRQLRLVHCQIGACVGNGVVAPRTERAHVDGVSACVGATARCAVVGRGRGGQRAAEQQGCFVVDEPR